MIASTSAFVALMAFSSALAAPATVKPSTSGALFFMTNDPSGNQLVINSINNAGGVSFVKTMKTGGKGSRGNGGGPDALFSQDSVLVSHGNLFVVNSGSNTLSAFKLQRKNPTGVRQIGKPMGTHGEFPVAVARSPGKLRQVCVVNGGKINGVECFCMDNKKGLSPLKNTQRSLGLNQTTPATGPPGTVSDILFSEDGKKLLVSVKGTPPKPGFIAQWDVAADGSLSSNFKALTATAGGLPFGMSIIPGQNALFATDPAVGGSTFSLEGSESTSAIPIDGQGAVCWSARSPKTGSFFVTDIKTSKITEITVDKDLKGKVVMQYPQTENSGTIDDAIGTIKGNDFLYVLAPNATSPQIDVLSVGNAPGQAKQLQQFDIGAALQKSKTKFDKLNLQGMAVFIP